MGAPSTVVGAILQGGRSTRMGRDKAGVIDGALTLREHVLRALAEVCDRVVQVGGPNADVIDVIDVIDVVGGSEGVDVGPFAGVVALLESGLGDVYVVAPVDMPRLTAPLLRQLLAALSPENDGVAFANHPLPVVLSATARARVRQAFDGGERRLKFLATRVVSVDDEAGLVNVNSEADLARLR